MHRLGSHVTNARDLDHRGDTGLVPTLILSGETETVLVVELDGRLGMRFPKPVRVLIADGHPVVRQGLKTIIERVPNMEIIAEASSWPSAVQKIMGYLPDVALLDVRMPGMQAVEGVAVIRKKVHDTRIVLLSASDLDGASSSLR